MPGEREQRVKSLEEKLKRFSNPRIHISIILALTAASAFLASFALLKLDFFWMAARYPLAILFAYGVFLVLLRIWLWFHGMKLNPDVEVEEVFDVNLPDISSNLAGDSFEFGGGGDFAGGGAGGQWGSPVTLSSSGSSDSGGKSIFDGLSFDIDLDDAWWLVLAGIAVLGGLVAVIWIVYFAPSLFAEILFDGVIAAGLYRRVKNIERRNWLESALRQTAPPALIVVVFSGIAGYALNKVAPEAHSIGDVLRYLLVGV